MEKSDLHRLIKIEDRVKQIVSEDMGLECLPVEFDVIPPEKMLEILAYRSPINISSWKFGRDYERLRTIFDNLDPSLPYEVVINSNPSRAYLMNSNTFAVQALVLSHVYGHVAVFTMNKWFQNSRNDLLEVMTSANQRFLEYEKMYGIDDVERIVDAGHAIQFHSNPFETETESERRKRIYEQTKQILKPDESEYRDLIPKKRTTVLDIDTVNRTLWRALKESTPVEPVEDMLRYIIDNSRVLDDWEKDILEILRAEGQYYWPIIKTKYINEGFATVVHQKIMDKLFQEGYLTPSEHGQYNYSNSLVKAYNRVSMNPYLIGSKILNDIEDRWNKGRYGKDWSECTNIKEKAEWDTHEMNGWKKVKEVISVYTDWFFMQDFLTNDLIDALDLYIYVRTEDEESVQYVRTNHTFEQIKQIIINSFAHSGIPKIEVVDGNYNHNGMLYFEHRYAGQPLETEYMVKTLGHIYDLWGKEVILKTIIGNEEKYVIYDGKKCYSMDVPKIDRMSMEAKP